jgi:putative oxygen-independent coproporphyrinogen III oxidase
VTAAAQLKLPPLSLYVHVPWCIRKCPYCDFNSHQQDGELPELAYLNALLADFEQELAYLQQRQIASIFIGGGTPSLMPAAFFVRLFEGLQKYATFVSDIEITLEANPGTAESQKFAEFRQAGINRLSIGIQSFNEEQLRNLGRIHGSEDSRRAILIARAAGFDNLNLDIMYGLSQQTAIGALEDLQTALEFAPEHLSWYQLTIEPNTAFFKHPPVLPHEDALIEIQDSGLALLAQQGYQRYEISAFALDGRRSRHNLNYWRFGDYLGIGAGAHGKITLPQQQTILRTRKKKQPSHYLNAGRQFASETMAVPISERAIEYMLNVLRLKEGFTREQFEAATGLGFECIQKQVTSLHQRTLLEFEDGVIRPSGKGQQFLNTMLEAFL